MRRKWMVVLVAAGACASAHAGVKVVGKGVGKRGRESFPGRGFRPAHVRRACAGIHTEIQSEAAAVGRRGTCIGYARF